MDTTERNRLIELYGEGPRLLDICLAKTPKEMWQFKPSKVDWSVHEILVHLADSESNSASRARLLITQPGEPIMAYDQDLWAVELDYHSQSWEDALEITRLARRSTYQLIKKLPDAVWGNSVHHPESDKPFTFEQWLEIYAGHIPAHIHQIENNVKLWEAKNS